MLGSWVPSLCCARLVGNPNNDAQWLKGVRSMLLASRLARSLTNAYTHNCPPTNWYAHLHEFKHGHYPD